MNPCGYGWRKYECGVPLHVYQPGDLMSPSDGLILWPAAVGSQLPKLNRWERLGGALVGFVSIGLARPHACVYSARAALGIISNDILSRTWIDGADAAEAYEYLLSNLLGVWLGNRTPYFTTPTSRLEDILKK